MHQYRAELNTLLLVPDKQALSEIVSFIMHYALIREPFLLYVFTITYFLLLL